jgi:hypothetical protein
MQILSHAVGAGHPTARIGIMTSIKFLRNDQKISLSFGATKLRFKMRLYTNAA